MYFNRKRGKTLVFLIFILVLINITYADEFSDTAFYDGDIAIKLSNDAYKAGDVLKAEITLFNGEPYPIADGFLVIELVYTDSDEDLVFYEKIIKDLTLTQRGSRTVNFEFPIDSKFRNENYRLDTFFMTKKTPISGSAHFFIPGESESFKIEGSGNFPKAKILGKKTWVLNEELTDAHVAPYGAENIQGKVFFEDVDSDAVLNLKVCELDDTTCDKFIIVQQYQIPKNTKSTGISFKAPQEPDFYAIRLELKKDNELMSLYRKDVVIQGETVTIRKLAIDKFYLKENDNVNLRVLLFGSPDSYNFPLVKETKLKVFVKNLENGNMVFEETRNLPDLDSASESLTSLDFNFNSPVKTNNFEVCAEAYSKDNKLLEDYCYTVDASKFILKDYTVAIDYNYNTENKDLSLNLCAVHDSGIKIKTNLQYLLMLNNNLIDKPNTVEVNGCSKKDIKVDKNNYMLIVNDLNQEKQYSFNIDLTKFEKPEKPEKLKKAKSYTLYGVILFILILILIIMILSKIRKKEEIVHA